RPVEEVFDYVADERHEPNFNSRMSRVELLTPEPIGAGSRFGIEMTMMRRVFDMTVEFTAFERPRLLGSTSRSLPRGGRGRPLVTAGSLSFDPVPEGTRMRWSWQVETPGAIKLLAPLVARMGRRQERRSFAGGSGCGCSSVRRGGGCAGAVVGAAGRSADRWSGRGRSGVCRVRAGPGRRGPSLRVRRGGRPVGA